VPDAEYEKLTKQALSIPLPVILHCLDTLQSALEKMYRGGDRRIELEMAMIRLCSPELDSTSDALIRRIEALERGGLKPQPSKAAKVPAAESEKAPLEKIEPVGRPAESEEPPPRPVRHPAETPPQSGTQDLQKGAERLAEWPEILQILKGYSRVIATAFNGSTAYISGAYVLIDAPNEIAFKLLRETTQRDNMRRAIQQVTGRTYNLGPYKSKSDEEQAEDPLNKLAGLAEHEGIEVIQK
jgi:DNA polymerase III subunit gamma/tau